MPDKKGEVGKCERKRTARGPSPCAKKPQDQCKGPLCTYVDKPGQRVKPHCRVSRSARTFAANTSGRQVGRGMTQDMNRATSRGRSPRRVSF